MSIASDVKALVAEFEKENPAYKGKACLTSGDRSWEEQLDIILDPKRKNNYPNIKKSFLKEFELKDLADDRSDLEKDQLAWWKKAILAQAGKPDGFAHVGGKALRPATDLAGGLLGTRQITAHDRDASTGA